jgi:integrin-linked kinase-associated serine/threonine phosphatase 2C
MQSILLKLLFIDMFQVVVANAGDAKAVLARSTSTDGEVAVVDTKSLLKAIVLTREHKAIFPQERSRIQKVNSYVFPTFSSVVLLT